MQDIYRQAALRLAPAPDQLESCERQLKEIGDDRTVTALGPVERAEILRFFVFRRLPSTSLTMSLRSVGILSVVMQIEPLIVAKFIADIATVFGGGRGAAIDNATLDSVFETIRNSAVPPADFFKAFEASRHLVLSRSIEPKEYFRRLREALESGVAPTEVAGSLYPDRNMGTP